MDLARGARRWMWMALMFAMPLTAHAQASQEVLDHPDLAEQRAELSMLLRSEDSTLPTELLIEKVREGIAKHVPVPRILQAVRIVRERMQVADGLLSGAPRAPVAARTAAVRGLVDALNAGLTRADLEAVLASLGSASRDLVAVREVAVTLAELAERGFRTATAVAAATSAWRQGGVKALPSVIALASRIGPSVSARDEALTQGVSQLSLPRGAAHAASERSNNAVHEPGPPHDDAFGAAQQRGRGLAKGRNK